MVGAAFPKILTFRGTRSDGWVSNSWLKTGPSLADGRAPKLRPNPVPPSCAAPVPKAIEPSNDTKNMVWAILVAKPYQNKRFFAMLMKILENLKKSLEKSPEGNFS